MLKRMSSNAIGLASITVLSTGIILSLVTPLTAAMGLTQITKEAMARDYSASLHVPLNQKIASTQEFEKLTDKLKQQVLAVYPKSSDIKNMNLNVSTMIPGNFKDNKFITIDPTNLDNISYFIIETVDQTNALYHDNHKLKANEIMVASNHISAQRFFSKKQKVEFMGQKFTALPLGHLVANQDALNAYRIIVPNWETLVKAANYYNNYQESKNDESRALASAEISLNWDSKLNLEQNSHYLSLISDHTIDQQPIITTTTIDIKNSIYEMNGGIIFIGLLIGISLLIGNILIIVYKQFSEGFEDRADFKIMKNVGLTPQLINQTSRKQILWLFFLPLIIASIHALASSNIIFMLLHLFGVNDFFNLMQNFGIVMASFTVIYILVFAITSKLYVKIVK